MNDEHYTKYSVYSDIDIMRTAFLSGSASPQFGYKYVQQNPNPDPITKSPYIIVINVYAHEYKHDENMPKGKQFVSNIHLSTSVAKDTSHLLWTSHIFPKEELKDNSITSAIILTLLENNNASCFNAPLNKNLSCLHHFHL